ncbi:metal-dependent hydrolase [Alicyclobacillus dauci]|uniref:Metal-dependent hydrolase n=1 Tax=Alicyclobacillus dauci TaxID=1475485 RepID=A0ABY6Z471_9BACL|nr:metal-dependent hydrolase [Alicyclobacillus dauci]WAH37116.1 metal-dependent hydrolase [Alicyclobacillus dauci]
MLGRTHMAIGLFAAAISAPVMYHVPHGMIGFTDVSRISLSNSLTKEVAYITAAAVGSLLPDLDQQDSKAARRIERVGQIAAVVAIIVLLFVMKLTMSPIAWLCVAGLACAVLTERNLSRRIGLGLMIAGLLYLAFTHRVPQTGAILLGLWGIGAMFTKHRTFTHSVLGTLVFLWGMHVAVGSLYGGVAFVGLSIGYVLHICADFVADGTVLLWPFSHRIGLPFVKTGGRIDQLIGATATVLFVVSLVRGGL